MLFEASGTPILKHSFAEIPLAPFVVAVHDTPTKSGGKSPKGSTKRRKGDVRVVEMDTKRLKRFLCLHWETPHIEAVPETDELLNSLAQMEMHRKTVCLSPSSLNSNFRSTEFCPLEFITERKASLLGSRLPQIV